MPMTADLRDYWIAAGVASGRVHRDLRPQGTDLPAVSIETITDAIDTFMKGEEALRETRLQINCYGTSRGQADATAAAIIAARPVRESAGGTNFRRLLVDQIGTDNDTPADGATTYRTRVDLIVWHRPA
jgi:hypothetical protein